MEDRLTYKSSMGDYGSAKDFDDWFVEKCALRNKLGRFEDLEVTPEQVKIYKDKDTPMKPYRLDYKLLTDVGWEFGCPNCKCAIGENKNAVDYTQENEFCPNCGQRLLW